MRDSERCRERIRLRDDRSAYDAKHRRRSRESHAFVEIFEARQVSLTTTNQRLDRSLINRFDRAAGFDTHRL